jgi:hypothetical protein
VELKNNTPINPPKIKDKFGFSKTMEILAVSMGYIHNYLGGRPSYTKEIVRFVQQVWGS